MYSTPVDSDCDAACAVAAQSAALCWRMHKGRVQVLLITSRDTGRWVIPKGWPMTGLSSAAAAAREAWEEAGVEGKVQETVLGTFVYDKLSRTVYLYVNLALLAKAEQKDIDFATFLAKDMEKFVQFANLIPLRALQYQENVKRVSFPR